MEAHIIRLATEVRHSIHAMMGLIELAAGEGLSARQAALLSNCRGNADRLLDMASDLCELSRPELPPHQLSVFQPAAAIAEVAELSVPLAERKGLNLDWRLTPGSQLHVEAPRDLIQDLLRRLLDNAVRYVDTGHIHVSGDIRREGEVDRLLVEVADTGGGLPEDVLSYVQSDDCAMLSGRGLGLAVVRHRLALLHGELSAVSRAGTGTIVRFSVPVQVKPAESAEATAPVQSGKETPMNLLVAEDSEDGFFVFEGYVREEGHRLTRALDGEQAIYLAQTGAYDLIVMDANMPLVDGYSATRAIREWESTSGRGQRTPILLFSADDLAKQEKMGRAAGCSGYLAKPASREEVLRALQFFAPAAPAPGRSM